MQTHNTTKILVRSSIPTLPYLTHHRTEINWKKHMMMSWYGNTFALLALCEGNPPKGLIIQSPSFDFIYVISLITCKLLKEQLSFCWFHMLWRSLMWHHCYQFFLSMFEEVFVLNHVWVFRGWKFFVMFCIVYILQGSVLVCTQPMRHRYDVSHWLIAYLDWSLLLSTVLITQWHHLCS